MECRCKNVSGWKPLRFKVEIITAKVFEMEFVTLEVVGMEYVAVEVVAKTCRENISRWKPSEWNLSRSKSPLWRLSQWKSLWWKSLRWNRHGGSWCGGSHTVEVDKLEVIAVKVIAVSHSVGISRCGNHHGESCSVGSFLLKWELWWRRSIKQGWRVKKIFLFWNLNQGLPNCRPVPHRWAFKSVS